MSKKAALILSLSLSPVLSLLCISMFYMSMEVFSSVDPPEIDFRTYGAWLTLTSILVPLIREIFVSGDSGDENAKDGHGGSHSPPIEAKGPIPEASNHQHRATYYERRKNQYKARYIGEYRSRMFAVHKLTKISEAHDRFARYAAYLLVAGLTAISHFLSGTMAAAVMASQYPNGTTGVDVPWYFNLLQSILIIPLVCLSCLLGFGFFRRYCCAERAGYRSVTQIAVFGVGMAGAAFFLQVNPEAIGIIQGIGMTVKLPGIETPIDYTTYLIVQRLAFLPIVGMLTCWGARAFLDAFRPPGTSEHPIRG